MFRSVKPFQVVGISQVSPALRISRRKSSFVASLALKFLRVDINVLELVIVASRDSKVKIQQQWCIKSARQYAEESMAAATTTALEYVTTAQSAVFARSHVR
jgi:hypothetical protein